METPGNREGGRVNTDMRIVISFLQGVGSALQEESKKAITPLHQDFHTTLSLLERTLGDLSPNDPLWAKLAPLCKGFYS